MKFKILGKSNLEISEIGFGAWAIGGGGWEFAWGDQDDKQSIAAIHRALEMGVNWIDTAAVYGLGHSEKIVAKAVKEWEGEKPFIFTKCSLVWDENKNITRTHAPESIRKECEASLRRLEIDSIDLYQVHWPPENDNGKIHGAMEMLSKLKEEGKIKNIGVSNFNIEQLKLSQKYAEIISLQPPYNLVNRLYEKEIFPFCEKEQIGTIIYSPMTSGLLTGKMTRERIENLSDGDWRKRAAEFNDPRLTKNLKIVERIKKVAEKYNASPGEIAIAWTLRNSAVTAAIVGARNAEQVNGVFSASEIKISDEDASFLENN